LLPAFLRWKILCRAAGCSELLAVADTGLSKQRKDAAVKDFSGLLLSAYVILFPPKE